jgi:hypothetical protein
MAGAAPAADPEGMRRFLITLWSVLAFGVGAHGALAAPARIAFDGGTPSEQATVRAALAASSFDWSVLPQVVTVHVGSYGDSYSTPGDVFVDAQLLDSQRFAWGVVQHEFGHQVDFLLLDDAKRAILQKALGAKDWCYGVEGLAHSDYGCERFASELSWAYWQSPDNSMQPSACGGESAGMPVTDFRALVTQLLGMPTTATSTTSATEKAYAPKTRPKAHRRRR